MYFIPSQWISSPQGHRSAPATSNVRRKTHFWFIFFSMIHGFLVVNGLLQEDFSFSVPAADLWVFFLKGFESDEAAKNIVISERYLKF